MAIQWHLSGKPWSCYNPWRTGRADASRNRWLEANTLYFHHLFHTASGLPNPHAPGIGP